MTTTAPMMDVITFGDLSKENVRLTPPLVNGERCLSIRDFIMVMCDKTRVRANDVWSSLSEDRKAELAAYVGFYHFKGKGERPDSPVITLAGALTLLSWLPGEAAKDSRGKITETITRHLAGDQALHAEINKNASSSSPLNVLARESQAAGGPCQVEIPVAYAVEVVQNEAEVGQKRKLDLEHFERINEAMQEFVTGREKCIEVEGRFQTCLNNTGKELALLQEKIEKGAGIARNSVVANMECLGQVDLDLHGDPAMRLLRGMAVACGMAVQMIGSEGVAFRQATLASLTAPVPVPVQPVQAIPVPVQPAQAIPVPVQSVEQAVPEPVQRLQAVAASAPDFVPSLPVPVPAPAKQQYTFGYIFVCLMKKSRLSLGAFKALAAHVSRRYQGKYKRPSTWLGNTHVYAEDEVEDVKAWVNEWMAV